MHDRDKIDRPNRLAGDLFSPNEPKCAGEERPPFDISQTALHKTKRDFMVDLNIVKSIVKHLHGILNVIDDAGIEKASAKVRIQDAVDKAIRNGTRRRKLRGGSSLDLIIQNIRESGFFEGSREVLTGR